MIEKDALLAQLTDPQKSRIAEALNKIEQLEIDRSPSLDLSGMALNSQDLELLMPFIADIHNLEILDLGQNELTYLPETLGELSRLQQLFLGGNFLLEIPDFLCNMEHLEVLSMEDNKIGKIPNEIQNLKQLQQLCLSNNLITEIPHTLGHLEALEILDLAKNWIKEIPECLWEMQSIRYLDFVDNELTEISQGIGNLKQLRQLFLSKNWIGEIPSSIGELSELQSLFLNKNCLRAIPEDIGNLKALRRLNLGGNFISEIPQSLHRLSQLEELYLRDNWLVKIPTGIGDLKQLRKLSASNNFIEEIPDGIYELEALEGLYLAGNRILEISDRIGDLTALEQLRLSNNWLAEIPKCIGALAQLQELYLSNNLLQEIPDSLGNLSKLEKLHIRANELTTLFEGVGNLVQLQKLDLSENNLTELPETIGQLAALGLLDLTQNPLRALPNTMTNLIPNLHLLIDLEALPASASRMLVHNFSIFEDQANQEVNNEANYYGYVLGKIYPGVQGQTLRDQIDQLDLGDFEVQRGDGLLDYTTSQVILEFIEKFPVYSAFAQEFYIPAAKDLLDQLLDPQYSQDQKKDLLQQMATALGACGTPVKQLLTQVGIGLFKDHKREPAQNINGILMAMALEQHIRKAFGAQLDKVEAAERVSALLHSLFLPNASKMDYNPLKIEGLEVSLPAFSRHVKFGFSLLDEEMVQKFGHLCCQTTADGQLLQQEGKYQTDSKKINAVIEPFLASLGLVSQRERMVQEYAEVLKAMLQRDQHLALLYYGEPEVEEILNVYTQQQKFRTQLWGVVDSDLKQTLTTALDQKQSEISRLAQSYKDEDAHLSQMGIPINENERLFSARPAHTRSASISSSPSPSPERASKKPRFR